MQQFSYLAESSSTVAPISDHEAAGTGDEAVDKTLFLQLSMVGVFMFVVTTMFEVGEEIIFPNLEIWSSHLRTISFTTGMAVLSAFYVLRHSRRLVTELERGEESLRTKQVQLTDLAMELALVEERERRNIAGELHDQVGQSLVLCKMKLNSLGNSMQDVVYVDRVEELNTLLERAIQEIRSVSLQLSPPLLTTAGLEPALEWLGEQIKADYGLQVEFTRDGQPKPLRDEVRSVIFTTVRELLINVAKHAKANHATIVVCRQHEKIRVVVEDDGVGFDISAVSLRTGRSGGFGLFNIRQNIEYLGGKLLVESVPGTGSRTTITASLDS